MEDKKSKKYLIKSKKQMFIVIAVFTLMLFVVGTTYAIFSYTRTGTNQQLITGDIYMRYTEDDNSIQLLETLPMTAEEARARNDNTFTFQITGKNTSTTDDIYYKLLLGYGDTETGKTRIRDNLLRFDLVEMISNNEEKYILYNETFSNITNAVLLKDRIDINTTSEITRTYKLRMWIDKSVLISDTDSGRDYTTSEWSNLYASVKVNAKGNTVDVNYFDSFASAVAAINSETYTSNITRGNAKAGIYVDNDDNTTNLVLYDDVDITDLITITKSVNINLYRNTIIFNEPTSESNTFISISVNSILENGYISAANGMSSNPSLVFYGGIMRNVDFQADYSSSSHFWMQFAGGYDFIIENCKLGEYGGSYAEIIGGRNTNVFMENNDIYGSLNCGKNGMIELDDSQLYWDTQSYGDNIFAINIRNTGSLIVNNSTIFADSPGCYAIGETYYNNSVGIINYGTLIFNSGYVFGTQSAVSTDSGSKTYVYGGTFESTSHGGFYFAHGQTGVAYIENANINGVSYPVEGKMRPEGTAPTIEVNGTTATLNESKSAFYIGGSSFQNGENVYLVDCNISAESTSKVFVMRSSTPEQNLYMSGCTFNNTRTTQYLRVDNSNTMRMYFGSNNNFGNIDKVNSNITFNEARNNGVIVDTGISYKGIVRPE